MYYITHFICRYGFRYQKCLNIPRTSVNTLHILHFEISCTIAHYFFSYLDPDVKNVEFFYKRPLRPLISNRLALTTCLTHIKGQTIPETRITPILMIFVCSSTQFFGDPDSIV